MDLDLGFDPSDNSDDDSSHSDSGSSHRSESGASLISAVSGFTTDGEGNLTERARSDGDSEYDQMDDMDRNYMDQLGLGLEEPNELCEELDTEVVDEDWGDDDRDGPDTGTSTLVPMDQEDDDVETEPPLLDAQNGLAASANGNGTGPSNGHSKPPTLTPSSSSSASAAALGVPVAEPANICERCAEPREFCHCDDTSVSSSDEAAVARLPLTGPSVKCKICRYGSKTFASKEALDEHVRKWHPEVNQTASTVTAATVRVPVGKKKKPAKWVGPVGDYNLDNWRFCDTEVGCGAKFKKEEDHNCVKYLKMKLESTEKNLKASQRKVKIIEKKFGKSQERVRELVAAECAKSGWSKDWEEEDEEDDEEDQDTDYVTSGSGRQRRQTADPAPAPAASTPAIAKRGRGRPPGSGKKSSKGKKPVKKSSGSAWNSARGKKPKSSPK